MPTGDRLGPTTRCPLASRCGACASTRDLEVATHATPVGVFCATACGPCVEAAEAPPVRGWAQACERVGGHCEHLGTDLDQMAALLHDDATRR
jgi:hypothetical protein